jgi:HK97 family phage prohead protease
MKYDTDKAKQKTGGPVFKQFDSEVKFDEDSRTATFTITTSSVDRDNDTISSDGWELGNFLRNPVVLFGHDSRSLPVGRATNITPLSNGLVSTVQFPEKGVYDFADTVLAMVKGGFLKATSVGFRPLEVNINEERGGLDFIRQELLEWSIVPVPANPEALMSASGSGIDMAKVENWEEKVLKHAGRSVGSGVSPRDISTNRADATDKWESPQLSDFESDEWETLSASQRQLVSGHYGWAADVPPKSFSDLKLPHHRPSDGAVVFLGVAEAAGKIAQAGIPAADVAAVKAHLRRHYNDFDRPIPSSIASTAPENEKDRISVELSTAHAFKVAEVDDFDHWPLSDDVRELAAVCSADELDVAAQQVAACRNDAKAEEKLQVWLERKHAPAIDNQEKAMYEIDERIGDVTRTYRAPTAEGLVEILRESSPLHGKSDPDPEPVLDAGDMDDGKKEADPPADPQEKVEGKDGESNDDQNKAGEDDLPFEIVDDTDMVEGLGKEDLAETIKAAASEALAACIQREAKSAVDALAGRVD